MNKHAFFQNFWSICTYAFLGTLLSTVVVAVLIIAATAMKAIYPFSAVDAFCFGSIISATDPVTVLAVFSVHDHQAFVGEFVSFLHEANDRFLLL
jgi:NhaP-type Na+/H+ or K+/H+ antiporter